MKAQHLRTKLLVAMVLTLFFSLMTTPTTFAAKNQVSDMNDRFATDTTGANGFARVRLTQDGELIVDRVKAKNLEAEHNYQVVVTIQLGAPFTGPSAAGIQSDDVAYSGTVTTDKHGNFGLDDFDTGTSAPGVYRIDVFVTHTHTTGPGSGAGGINLTAEIARDPLLACQPAFIVTVI